VTLLKTSFLNAIAVIIKMLTMLGINKVLAVYVGPAGYAMIGQLQNAISMLLTFSSGAMNTGVTKYTAEYDDDEDEQHKVWLTAFKLTVFSVLFISLLVFIFSETLADYFLKSSEYSIVFVFFSCTLIFFAINAQILAVLNGKKEILTFAIVNIIGSLIGLILTIILAVSYGLIGALLALVLNQSIVFFVSFIAIRRFAWFKRFNFKGGSDREIAIKLLKYALMGLAGAIMVPISHIFVRTHLGETFGWENAGYWDAIWRISSVYLMFVTTVLSVYFLPRYAEIKTKLAMRAEIINGYKIIIPTVLLMSSIIFVMRETIIVLLFTNSFLPMKDLFFWQLIGDVLKITSWVLGYIILAKAMTRLFIVSEIIFAFSFYIFTLIFTYFFGIEGVTYAHSMNYFFHLLFMFTVLKLRQVF
jgi:polysaccharide transporter, PST family